MFLTLTTNLSFLSLWMTLSKGSSFLLFTAAVIIGLTASNFGLPWCDCDGTQLKFEPQKWDFWRVQLNLVESLGFEWKGSVFERKKGKGVDDEGEESRSEGSI